MHFEKIDKYLKPQSIDVSLCKPDKSIIAKLNHSFNRQRKLNLSSLNEFTFSLPFYIQDENHRFVENPLIKKTKARYLIRIEEIDGKDQNNQVEYYIIDNISKSMDDDSLNYDYHAFSLGHELADKTLKNFEVNGKNVSDILNQFLFNTRWSVGYVDEEFITNGRSFNVSEKTYLDFIFEVAEKFNAVTQWDTVNRKINFVKPDNVGKDRGFRISYGKYLKSISEESNSNEMVTRLKLYGSEGLTVHSVNPIGVGYIEDFSYFMYPFQIDENGKITQHSYYMSDGLCKGLLGCQKLIKDTENEFKGYLDDLEVEQFNLRTKLNELSVLNTELSQIQAEIDITNSMQRDTSQLVPKKEAKQLEVNSKKDEVEQIESKISVIQNNIKDYRNKIDISNFITPDEQQELKQFIIEKEWTNDSITDANKLLEEGQKEFEKLREPQTVLNIDIINFYEIVDEFKNWSRMFLGDVIRINHERLEIDVKAKIISMDLDYETESIKLEIANVKEILTDEDVLIKQLYKASQTSATINSDKYKWENASQKVTEVDDIINGKWDAIKREIEGGTEKDVSISKRGIIIRDLTDPSSYLIAQNAVLGITNDGGNTWKHAITKNGIVGENIYGKMFIGKNLIMENDSGKFRFDNDGVTIEGSALRIIGGLDEEQINGNFLKAGKEYNGTVIDSESGIVVTSSMNKTRTILNATEGIKIEANIGTSGNEDWVQRFYVDDKGDLYANDLYARRFRLLDDNGKIMIDGNTKTLNFAGFQNIDGTVPFKTVEGLPEEVTTIKQDTATAITDSSIAKQEANFAKTETINVKKDMEQMELEQIERDKQIQEQLKDKEMKMHRGNNPPLNPLVNQLWIDTSGTFNVIKRWDGVKWVNLAPEKASDLGAVLQTEYDTKMTEYDAKFNNTMLELADKADLTYVDGKLVSKADKETTYTKVEVDNALNSKVSVLTYNTDKEGIITQLSDHESRVTQTENEISTRVTKTEFNAGLAGKESTVFKQTTAPTHMNGRLWLDTSKIPNILYRSDGTKWVKATPTTASEVDAYSNTDGSTLATKLSTAESNITQLSDQIALKVAKIDYELDKSGILLRLNTAESSITQQKDMIEARVTKTEFDNLQIGGVNLIHDGVIAHWGSKFQKNDYLYTLTGKLGGIRINESIFKPYTEYVLSFKFKKISGSIVYLGGHSSLASSMKVYRDDVFISTRWGADGFPDDTNEHKYVVYFKTGDMATGDLGLYIQPNRGSKYEFDYVAELWDLQVEEGNKVTTWQPSPQDTQNQIDGLGTRVSTAESTITQLDNQIKLKVSKTDYDTDKTGILSRLNSAESSITQNADSIATKVSQTTYDLDIGDLTSRVGTAESTISQQADMISTKVEKNGVISAINQSPESIKLNANRIDLTGYATFSSLSTSGQTVINADNLTTGKISAIDIEGVNIKGSTITSTSTDFGTLNIDGGAIGSEMNIDNIKYVSHLIRGALRLQTSNNSTNTMTGSAYYYTDRIATTHEDFQIICGISPDLTKTGITDFIVHSKDIIMSNKSMIVPSGYTIVSSMDNTKKHIRFNYDYIPGGAGIQTSTVCRSQDYQPLTLINGFKYFSDWGDQYRIPSFNIDSSGYVTLDGALGNNSSIDLNNGVVFANLPDGYRPEKASFFPINYTTHFIASLYVNPNGNISIYYNGLYDINKPLFLHGVRFKANGVI